MDLMDKGVPEAPEDDDRIPRFSWDLVEWLDQNTPRPTMPMTARGFAGLDEAAVRLAAFQAGVRSLVDQLVDWRDEQEEKTDEDPSVSDGSGSRFPAVLRGDGELPSGLSSIRVDV